VVETTKPCTPCDNLFLLPYVGPERGPEFLKATLGRRGWFARIVNEGRVRKGDRIEAVADG
jgi:MOSC domain-containing protein YiiM